MGACAACNKFTRATRFCSYFSAFIALKAIHQRLKCDGYKRKKEAEP